MRYCLVLSMFVAALLPSTKAAAHLADEFPQVTLQIAIDDEAVELIVRVPAKVASVDVFDGMSPVAMDQMEPADLSALVGRVFAERCPLTIDGVVVPPVVLGAVVSMSNSRLPARRFPAPQVMKQGMLKFFARYETKGRPSSVKLDWSIFANEYDADDKPIYTGDGLQVVGVVQEGGREQIVLLTPGEPVYAWQGEDSAASLIDLQVRADVRRDMKSIPELSILILLIGVAVVLFIWRRSHRFYWAPVVVTIVLSAIAFRFGQTHYSSPSYIEPPSDLDRLANFESLHRNIYRAFDYTDEGAVYDALAQSVGGAMLESIYNDVYQSLIIREEEDALSRVVRVEMQAKELLSIEQDAEVYGEFPYRVRCQWEVDGLVTHYGHSHARTNAFEAIYTIAAVGSQWRIVDAEILDQRRIDDGQQTAEDLLQDP